MGLAPLEGADFKVHPKARRILPSTAMIWRVQPSHRFGQRLHCESYSMAGLCQILAGDGQRGVELAW